MDAACASFHFLHCYSGQGLQSLTLRWKYDRAWTQLSGFDMLREMDVH